MKTLKEQFNQIDKMPLFEIDKEDFGISYEKDRYEVYNIIATDIELKILYTNISVEWDDTFSLDEHIQALYELCIQDLYNKEK